MEQVKVTVNTKVLQAEMTISVVTADKVSIERKLEDLIKLTGGKVYVCEKCYSVFLTDEPLKKVYNCSNDTSQYICEKCCEDMVIVDVEILLNDLKRHNVKYLTIC